MYTSTSAGVQAGDLLRLTDAWDGVNDVFTFSVTQPDVWFFFIIADDQPVNMCSLKITAGDITMAPPAFDIYTGPNTDALTLALSTADTWTTGQSRTYSLTGRTGGAIGIRFPTANVTLDYQIKEIAFYHESTCSDMAMGGDEEGVDCGGSCPMQCGISRARPNPTKWIYTADEDLSDFDQDTVVSWTSDGGDPSHWYFEGNEVELVPCKVSIQIDTVETAFDAVDFFYADSSDTTIYAFSVNDIVWTEDKEIKVFDISSMPHTWTVEIAFVGAHDGATVAVSEVAVYEKQSCDDGVRSGDEEGIDCGGFCEPCQMKCQRDSTPFPSDFGGYVYNYAADGTEDFLDDEDSGTVWWANKSTIGQWVTLG